jgi:PAS domain S-box-containing protein
MTEKTENVAGYYQLSPGTDSYDIHGTINPGGSSQTESDLSLVNYLPGFACAFAILMGALVLIGWWQDIAVLKSVMPGLPTMKPLAAAGFILSGTALWLLAGNKTGYLGNLQKSIGYVLALVISILGASILSEYLFMWDLGIDQAIALNMQWSERIAFTEALNFFLTGPALFLINVETKRGFRPSQWIALFTGVVSLFAISGYIIGFQNPTQVAFSSVLALNAAISFVVLALGFLFSGGNRGLTMVLLKDSLGGSLARHLLPAAVILPFLFRWVRMKGEQSGFYENDFGIALFATTNILILTLLIWRSALSLDRSDSQRVRAEQNVLKSTKELENITFALDESSIVAITDQTGRINFVNDKFCEISGYSREELLGQDHRIINSAYHSKEFIRNIWITIASGKVWKGEIKNRAKSGTYYWVDTTIVPFLNEKGRPYQYVAIRNDITQRKLAEESVTESEARFRTLADTAPVLIWMSGTDMLCNYFNKKWLEFTGRTIEEELGNGWADGVHANDMDRCLEIYRSNFEKHSEFEMEYQLRRADGEYRWILDKGVPRHTAEGEFVGYIGTCLDITERKLNGERLAQLATIVETSDDAILSKTTDGTITSWNAAATRIYGYTMEEMLGQSVSRLIPPEYPDQLKMILTTLGLGGQVEHLETERVKKDGTRITVSITASPIHDANGKVVGASTIARDITQKKRSEKELQESKAQLETIVENINEGITVSDLNGNLLHFNRAALHMHDFSSMDECRLHLQRFGDIFELREMDGTLIPLEEWPLARVLRGEKLHDVEIKIQKVGSDRCRIFNYGGTLVHEDHGKPLLAVVTINDITERKSSEEALKNNEHRFRTLIEHGSDSIALIDQNNKILYLSPSVKNVEGYEPEELLGRSGVEHTHPDDLPLLRNTVEELMKNPGKPISRIWRRRHKDGHWMWLEGISTNLLDDPAVGAIVTNYRDITKRKEAEEEILESEARYRLLFENNPFPMWVYDLETLDFLAVNDSATFYYGYSRQEFLSMTIKDIRPPEEIPALMKNVALVHAKIDSADIWKHRKKDGSIIDVEVTSHELVFGGRRARLVLANDITERKRAQEKLAESQEQFRELTESLPQLVWTSRGDDGSCDYLSPQWLEYTGIPAEKQLGFGWVEQVHPDDREATMATWDMAVNTASVFDVEFRIRRFDEEYHWFKTRAVPVKDEAGAIVKWIGTNTDIEDSRRAAEEIRKLNETLEQRVIERTQELEASNKELEAFSYSVSHDLRAPLRAIDGFSLALLEDYTNKLDAEGQNYLTRVRLGSQRMAQLIDDLLKLSRITRTEFVREAVDLSKAATDISDRLRESQPERNVKLNIQPGVTTYGDERLMRVALENLLGNAWKFTSKRDDAEVSFGHDGSEYFVRDNGAGFDMAYADKLFGAFQRLHSATDFEGTGIGLATVQRVIRRHGGNIRAESKVGEGTVFYFTLSGQEARNGN